MDLLNESTQCSYRYRLSGGDVTPSRDEIERLLRCADKGNREDSVCGGSQRAHCGNIGIVMTQPFVIVRRTMTGLATCGKDVRLRHFFCRYRGGGCYESSTIQIEHLQNDELNRASATVDALA